MQKRRVCARRTGFTLVETAVAVSVSSVLILALGSAVLIASRAVPTGQETVIRSGDLERAEARMVADLSEALDLAVDSSGLTLAVPDRDGDGVEELIEYVVTEGGMVTRSQNRAAAETLFGPIKGVTFRRTTSGTKTTAVRMAWLIDGAEPPERVVEARLLNTPETR